MTISNESNDSAPRILTLNLRRRFLLRHLNSFCSLLPVVRPRRLLWSTRRQLWDSSLLTEYRMQTGRYRPRHRPR